MTAIQQFIELVSKSQQNLIELQVMITNYFPAESLIKKVKETNMYLAKCYELGPDKQRLEIIKKCKRLLDESIIQVKLYDIATKHKDNEMIVSPCNKMMYCKTFIVDHFNTCEICKMEIEKNG